MIPHRIDGVLALQNAPLQGLCLDGQRIALHLQLFHRQLQLCHAAFRLAVLQLRGTGGGGLKTAAPDCLEIGRFRGGVLAASTNVSIQEHACRSFHVVHWEIE